MVFFEDFVNVKTDMKIGITNLLSNITTREGSHKGGWARLLKCQLKNLGHDDVTILDNSNSLSEFDVIIFDLGAEYSGALNLFGGLDEKVFKRLQEIKNYTGDLYSWRNPIPSVVSLSGRRNNASTCQAFKEQAGETFLEDVQERLNFTQVFDHAYRTDSLLIGDSHTPSVWHPTQMIERQDGRTLYGSTRNNTVSRIVKSFDHQIRSVQIHMSSIDIRHHVCRQLDPEGSVYEMLTKLGNELVDLKNQCKIDHVILTQTVGIEDESRELPKTGYYKGTAFFGDWERRNMVRDYFNEKIKEMAYMNNKPGSFEWIVVEFPEYFFDKSGKLRFDVMERPGSVHLSPEFYRWDLDKNELRWSSDNNLKMKVRFATLDMAKDLEKSMYGA